MMSLNVFVAALVVSNCAVDAFLFWGPPHPSGRGGSVMTNNPSVTYIGCYGDNHSRDLDGHYLRDNNGMTINMCLNACESQGFEYFGVEYGVECSCGNSYGRYGTRDGCDYSCVGNRAQRCGSLWKNDVYQITSNNREDWRSGLENSRELMGCYRDALSRDLKGYYLRDNNDMTIEMCQETCMERNYNYMGVESGDQCFCDNDYGSHGEANGQCNDQCAGDRRQICGDFFKLSIYKIKGIVRPCPANCIAVECIDGECVDCAGRYFLRGGDCVACPDNCARCNTGGSCTDCDSGYTRRDNGNCEEIEEIEPLEYLGYEIQERGTVDRESRNSLILTDTTLSVQTDSGLLIGWEVTNTNNRPFTMSIWRPQGGNRYSYVGGTLFEPDSAGMHEVTLMPREQFRVQNGDVLGVAWTGSAVVRYKQTPGGCGDHTFLKLGQPAATYRAGETIVLQEIDRKCGEYRLQAVIDPNQ